jgi:hypothetical protein
VGHEGGTVELDVGLLGVDNNDAADGGLGAVASGVLGVVLDGVLASLLEVDVGLGEDAQLGPRRAVSRES